MLGGKALAQLFALLLQGDDLVIHRDDRAEHALGLDGEVHRSAGLPVVVVGRFGSVELALEDRQLGFEKAQRALGFGRAVFDVLPHVGVDDVIEHPGQRFLVGAGEGCTDHAGATPPLGNLEAGTEGVHGLLATDSPHHELGARPRLQFGDEDLQVALLRQLADAPAEQFLLRLGAQDIAVGIGRLEGKRRTLQRWRHGEALEPDAFAAPGILAQAQQGCCGRIALIAACDRAADDRRVARRDHELEVQAVDNPPEDHARAEDLELGADGRRIATKRLNVLQCGEALVLVFDLKQGIGLVDGRADKGDEDADAQCKRRHHDDQPLVFEDNGDELAEVDGLFVVVGRPSVAAPAIDCRIACARSKWRRFLIHGSSRLPQRRPLGGRSAPTGRHGDVGFYCRPPNSGY